ncbi:hypothetical protein KSC_031650 [Ktedonobacter sp. SOSP1-52]|nr:hypothetical protein KSC_031650 [Ktedonobacter sp. SOSP1-52]
MGRAQFDDLHAPAKLLVDPIGKRASVCAIDPYMLHPRISARPIDKQKPAAIAILDVGGMDTHCLHEAFGINEQVAFSAEPFVNLSRGVASFTRLQNWT